MKNRRLTVHVARSDRLRVREGVHHQCEQCPHEKYNVCEVTDGPQPERSGLDVGSASDEEADDGDGVAEIQEDNTSSDHTV